MNLQENDKHDWYRVYLMASSLVFFVSFLRAVVSLSIVAILPQVSALLVVLFLMTPIVIILILNRFFDVNYSSSISIIWILGIILSILQTNQIIRFCLFILGLGLALTEIARYIRIKQLNHRQAIVWFITIDFVLRLLNYGQEPLIYITNSGYKILILGVVVILGLGSLYMRYHITAQINKGRSSLKEIAIFILLFIYIFLVGNPHTLVWNTGLSLDLSLLLGTVLMMGSIAISSIFERIDLRLALISVLLLVQTSIFHPWDNISVFFLVLSPLSFILIFSYIFNSDSNEDLDTPKLNHSIIGFFILIVLIYVLLIYELYILFPLAGFSLLAIISRNDNRKIRLDFTFKSYRILYATLLLSILFLPMIYQPLPAETITQPNFRVLSYNIHYGTDVDGFDAVDRLVDFIQTYEPSVIAFQEITVTTPLNGFGNVYGKLMRELGRFGFTNYVISSGGQYSLVNAIFSLYPIISSITLEITPVVEYKRTAIVANLDVRGKIVTVVSTHLTNVGSSSGTAERVLQVENLIEQLQSVPNLSNNLILAGDFNTVPTSNEYDILTGNYFDSWTSWTNNSSGYTSPSDDPNKRIDYIFYSNMQLFSFELIQTTISDHLPLICDFNSTIVS